MMFFVEILIRWSSEQIGIDGPVDVTLFWFFFALATFDLYYWVKPRLKKPLRKSRKTTITPARFML